tara:strand:- start:1572 stop:3065 length:1494 start_codon:yes stop_codon:yes gene_type:complete
MQKIKFKGSLSYLILSLSSALVFSASGFTADNTNLTSYASNDTTTVTEQLSNAVSFTDAELEQMLAPIALYPDALLSHILIATTYPIEVVDAERWLNKNSQLSAQALADAAENKDWDASVKALLPFPNILKKLSDDLHWMRNLGDAFLQDEAQVLASIQILRKQADHAGNLKDMDNVNVVRESQTIIIESRQPDIIYVPYYDTRIVYGDWRWSHHPPIFWHYPQHYASHHGAYYWDNPVHLTLGLFFGAVHWNNHHVVVHHHKSRYYKHHSNKKVSSSYQATRWQHNPRHRKGVAYRTSQIQKKYRSHTPSVQQHKVLRSKQKYGVHETKHETKHANRKYTDSKSQSLKHKLQVNRAVKIDQHKVKKSSLTKHEPYKSKKWRKNEQAPHVYSGNVKSAKTIKSPAKQYKNKPNLTKSYVKENNYKHSNKQNSHAYTSKAQAEKSYTKADNAPSRSSYKKSQNSKSEKRVHKRSTAKVASHDKSRASSTHKSRAKQHN